MEQNAEVTAMLQSLRETKNALEKQVLSLQMERDSESLVRKRLFESEVRVTE